MPVDHAIHIKPKDHRTYDLWVSSLSSDVLAPIEADEQDTWVSTLQLSPNRRNIYSNPSSERRASLRMNMNPATSAGGQFLQNWSNAPVAKVGSESPHE